MATDEWGLCRDCKWWQIEPKAAIENLTMGLCIDEDLQVFVFRVSGNSGCNRFMAGKPARAAGHAKHLAGRGTRARGFAHTTIRILDLQLALHQVASVPMVHIDDPKHLDLAILGLELLGEHRGIRIPAPHHGVELVLGEHQVRMRLKLVPDAGVARAGGPEEDDFGGALTSPGPNANG